MDLHILQFYVKWKFNGERIYPTVLHLFVFYLLRNPSSLSKKILFLEADTEHLGLSAPEALEASLSDTEASVLSCLLERLHPSVWRASSLQLFSQETWRLKCKPASWDDVFWNLRSTRGLNLYFHSFVSKREGGETCSHFRLLKSLNKRFRILVMADMSRIVLAFVRYLR